VFNSSRTFFGALAAVALAFSLPSKGLAQGVKNIVLVHGALADGSSWSKIIPLLQAKGQHVTCVQNPLTSQADDVAAAAPDAGQSLGELTKDAPTPGVNEFRPDAAGFLSLSHKGMLEDFGQDLPLAAAIGDKVTTVAWQTRPSWYIVASEDRMISPDLERTMAKKIHATSLELKSSHVPMLSQPTKVAAFIVEAAPKAGDTK